LIGERSHWSKFEGILSEALKMLRHRGHNIFSYIFPR
jgi:hypothetical protein